MDGAHVERYAGNDIINETDSTCKLVGGSMLTFSIDPQWGNMYFWLGKERRNSRWPEGSETWSDFGGRPHELEGSHDIAAREFVEESCGMLRYFPSDVCPRRAWTDIAADLRQGNYLFRITMWTTTAEGVKKLFVTYVKQIPWQPQAAEEYDRSMTTLVHIKMALKHGGASDAVVPRGFQSPALTTHIDPTDVTHRCHHINRDYMEKETIRMWSVPRLREAIEGYMGVGDGGPVRSSQHHGPDTPVNIGFRRVERFRRCFVTLMNCVIRELVYHEPSIVENPPRVGIDARRVA